MLELTKQTKRLERQLCELEILLDAERQATAQRIEELEGRLTAERETARKYAAVAEREMDIMWGDDEPHESGDECLSCERPAMQETWPYCRICLLTAQLEVCDEGFAEARPCIERLVRQLREAQEAAQAQSEAVQRDWLSPAEAEGLRQQLEAERQAAVACSEEAPAWPHFSPCNCPGCKLVRGIRQAAIKGGTE